MNNATKADSRSAQTEKPVYISKDVSVEKIDGGYLFMSLFVCVIIQPHI